VLVKRGGLKAKAAEQPSGKVYRVQVGAFSNKPNAEKLAKALKNDGYDAIIV
jgi:N-acetylmuramoyl-L-alanine amidase